MPEPTPSSFNETPSREVERKRFGTFRDSGWGQFAEALWILSKEHPKKFWIGIFVAGWMFVNGVNNIAGLIEVARKTGDFLTILNPFAG